MGIFTPFTQLTTEQFNTAETAPWKELLRQAIYDLRVSIPGIVQEFDPASGTVTVVPAIRENLRTPNGIQVKQIPPIANVPLCFQSGGGFSLTLPIQPGDEGLLVFCDMCIDLWWARGGIQNQFEERRHDISDCGFWPGGRSQPRALPSYSANSAQLRSDDGSTYVEIAAGQIVNIVAPSGVNITGNLVVSGEVTGNGIPLSTHLHPGVQAGGSDTGAPIP